MIYNSQNERASAAVTAVICLALTHNQRSLSHLIMSLHNQDNAFMKRTDEQSKLMFFPYSESTGHLNMTIVCEP